MDQRSTGLKKVLLNALALNSHCIMGNVVWNLLGPGPRERFTDGAESVRKWPKVPWRALSCPVAFWERAVSVKCWRLRRATGRSPT